MSEIQIDHEAAIQTAQQYNDPDCCGEIDNLSRAYLDSQRQLAAERARVDALVWLVRLAFTTGRTFGMNCYELGEHSAFSFYESDFPKQLTAILNAHAQGDEA